MNPFLRWAGSKRRLLPTLIESVPESFGRYIEPFAGSACLFFALDLREGILGDVNPELIHTYREVKKNVNEVIENLTAFKNTAAEYYSTRALNPSLLTPSMRAARLIYLNRFCFNGLYRTNRDGQFNVPYGGYKCGPLPSANMLHECSRILKKVKLVRGSFEKTLEYAQSGDFVYLDPPYCIRSRRVFSEYSHFNFGDDQLSALRKHLKTLNQKGVLFLVSYGVSHEAKELAKDFQTRRVTVKRHIAGKCSQRRRNRELLITNF